MGLLASWAGLVEGSSLLDIKMGVFQRDVPGLVKAGTDVTSHSDSWLVRM